MFYVQSCECRLWALVRLTAGLLTKRLEELGKAVTHLLVRQKQITVSICFTVYFRDSEMCLAAHHRCLYS